jgi:hypothetical protein
VGQTYLFPALSSGGASVIRPWLRFHMTLIDPDRRPSRINVVYSHLMRETCASGSVGREGASALAYPAGAKLPLTAIGVEPKPGTCRLLPITLMRDNKSNLLAERDRNQFRRRAIVAGFQPARP